jgi:hypothetical protein
MSLSCPLILKVKKEKGLIEEKDEFDMMEGNQKTLADRLGISPEDIEKKMNEKRRGMYVTIWKIKNLFFILLLINSSLAVREMMQVRKYCQPLFENMFKVHVC